MITLTENDCKIIRDRLRNHLLNNQTELARGESTKKWETVYGKSIRKLKEKEVDDTLKALSYL